MKCAWEFAELPFGLPHNLNRVWVRIECATTACTLSEGHTGPHECERPFGPGRVTWWDADHPAPGHHREETDPYE